MVDLVEDEQGTCPGPAGGLGVTRAELNVAEVIECVGFVEAVREFPVEVDGSLVARDGSLVLAGKGSLAGQSYETYNASGFATMYNHTLADFASFFGDLEIISPGLGDARQIRPGWRELSTAARRPDRILAGIARVPYRAR